MVGCVWGMVRGVRGVRGGRVCVRDRFLPMNKRIKKSVMLSVMCSTE